MKTGFPCSSERAAESIKYISTLHMTNTCNCNILKQLSKESFLKSTVICCQLFLLSFLNVDSLNGDFIPLYLFMVGS